ncbi:MAG: PAS domain-containing protein [Hyphomicrobiales bacterium]
MSSANGTLGEIIKALDISGVEMIALGLPESRIIDVSRRLTTAWTCSKYEIVGHVLSSNAGTKIHARYVDADVTGADLRGGARIEVTLERSDKPSCIQRFRPHYFRDGSDEFLLLLAEAAPPGEPEKDARLKLAVEAGGFFPWDYDVRSHQSTVDPGIADMLGLKPDMADLAFDQWNALIHPDDQVNGPAACLTRRPVPPQHACRVRMRHANGRWIWVEFIAHLVSQAVSGEPLKIIGLARDVSEEMDGHHRTATSERALWRALGTAQIGAFSVDVASGRIDISDELHTLLSLAAPEGNGHAAFVELATRVSPRDYAPFEAAFTRAALGEIPEALAVSLDMPGAGDRRFRFTFSADHDGDGNVERISGLCQDITALAALLPAREPLDDKVTRYIDNLSRALNVTLEKLEASETAPVTRELVDTLQDAIAALSTAGRSTDPLDGERAERTVPFTPLEATTPGKSMPEPFAFAPEQIAEPSPPETEAEATPLAPPLPPEDLADEPITSAAPAPAAPSMRPAPQATIDSKPAKSGNGTPRALVVEDEADLRDTIVAMLADIGLSALSANEGAEALDKLRRTPSISLVVSDVVMQGVSGPEFITEAFAERPDLRAILTSGYDLSTMLSGVDLPTGIELMPKPFTRAEFLKKVEALLAPAAAA